MIKESVYTRWLSLALRLLLGCTFIFSSLAKLPMQFRFIDVVQSYHLLPDIVAAVYGLLLPWVEILTGCYLVLGIFVKLGAIVTLLMGISFLVANIGSLVRGESYCPNCFGELVPLTVAQAISIDILVIIAASILLVVAGKKEIFGFDSWYTGRHGLSGTKQVIRRKKVV